MSITTIVIIVISVTLLILGMVFVRTVMCAAIGLTGELSNKVEGEIDEIFGSTGGEVHCIGESGEPIKLIPGRTNIIWCGIRAPVQADYKISLESMSGSVSSDATIENYLIQGGDYWDGTVVPGDEVPKKVLRLSIPKNAPEEEIFIQLEAFKDGTQISTHDLDFEVSRVGMLRTTMC